MASYIGLQAQQVRNNTRSMLLLVLFPVLVLVLVVLFAHAIYFMESYQQGVGYDIASPEPWQLFLDVVPWVLAMVGIWFAIAWFSNTAIIRNATGARPLERKNNKRVYNLVENLCMSQGMPIPKINIIDDSSLNAFASGINRSSYTVTLTSGIIERLDDEQLEGVIAHELSHIRNHDVRLLIVSIVFVGIFSMIAQVALRSLRRTRIRSNSKGGGGVVVVILIVALLAAIGYFFATLMRFAISRKREYLADAAAAEMTRNPLALAGALRAISGDPQIESIKRDDVAQLFIEHPLNSKKRGGWLRNIFATHPPIEQRIAVLEQF